jgi:hypothetical protein
VNVWQHLLVIVRHRAPADDPVIADAGNFAQTPVSTGCPAFAGHDKGVRGFAIRVQPLSDSQYQTATLNIPPRDSGEGGPRSCAVGGALASTIFLRLRIFSAACAPSTTLRVVPLPRCSRGRMQFVIASGAKQSSAQCEPPLDCFVASLLAMTNSTVLAVRSAPESSSRSAMKLRTFRSPHRSSPENTDGGHRHLTIFALSHE